MKYAFVCGICNSFGTDDDPLLDDMPNWVLQGYRVCCPNCKNRYVSWIKIDENTTIWVPKETSNKIMPVSI